MLGGFGPAETDSIGVRDLRFYVSNLKFYDQAGEILDVELDSNEFQYNSDQGFVALIDLTSNSSGSCASETASGTERTNTTISGTVEDQVIADVSFEVGLPQAIMKAVIATQTEEDAPTPLNEMYWSWVSGYRHFVFDFAVMNTEGTFGEGYLHIGSRGCGAAGEKALLEKDQCDLVNTPSVMLEDFDPDVDSVAVDVSAALASARFAIDLPDGEQTAPGINCHSSPTQADCAAIFVNFGLDITTGEADMQANTVFSKSE
ncbi:MAG: metallo-mystery pair system four-Cys motif protein [Cellvibrionaceae bacterium]|nr:metallo-mystery pair system four-Cys motif protein [Cellvibrionaceae bacterium]